MKKININIEDYKGKCAICCKRYSDFTLLIMCLYKKYKKCKQVFETPYTSQNLFEGGYNVLLLDEETICKLDFAKELGYKIFEVEDFIEEEKRVKKVVMNLDDYKGSYAMHCPTEELAKLFCDFLDENGRKWENGENYKDETKWDLFRTDNIYLFNEGLVDCRALSSYKILEIEDFIVDFPITREEIEERIFQQAKYIFRIYKMYNPHGEYLTMTASVDDEDKDEFVITANNECFDENKIDSKLPVDFYEKFKMEDLK